MFLRVGGWGGKGFCELPLDDLLPLVEAFLTCNALLWTCSGDVLEICKDDDGRFAEPFHWQYFGNCWHDCGNTGKMHSKWQSLTMTNGVLNTTCWDYLSYF